MSQLGNTENSRSAYSGHMTADTWRPGQSTPSSGHSAYDGDRSHRRNRKSYGDSSGVSETRHDDTSGAPSRPDSRLTLEPPQVRKVESQSRESMDQQGTPCPIRFQVHHYDAENKIRMCLADKTCNGDSHRGIRSTVLDAWSKNFPSLWHLDGQVNEHSAGRVIPGYPEEYTITLLRCDVDRDGTPLAPIPWWERGDRVIGNFEHFDYDREHRYIHEELHEDGTVEISLTHKVGYQRAIKSLTHPPGEKGPVHTSSRFTVSDGPCDDFCLLSELYPDLTSRRKIAEQWNQVEWCSCSETMDGGICNRVGLGTYLDRAGDAETKAACGRG